MIIEFKYNNWKLKFAILLYHFSVFDKKFSEVINPEKIQNLVYALKTCTKIVEIVLDVLFLRFEKKYNFKTNCIPKTKET